MALPSYDELVRRANRTPFDPVLCSSHTKRGGCAYGSEGTTDGR